MATSPAALPPLVQIDDVGSIAIDDHPEPKPEPEPAATVATAALASSSSSGTPIHGTFPAGSDDPSDHRFPAPPAHFVGFGEGWSSHVEDESGSSSKRARTEADGLPKLPVFIADTRTRLSKLMRLIEQGERSAAARDAGAFVIRVCPYDGMNDTTMQQIAKSRRIWTKQRFTPTSVHGAYHLKVTNLNNKSENGNPVARIDKESFWDDLGTSTALYSHDFSSALHSNYIPWDMNNLIDSENFLPKVMPDSCPGINSTFGYLGQAGSSFAWHVEDACLGSMNVSLGGATKVWYTVSPKHQQRFRSRVLRACFPADYRRCDGFDQHKQGVVSPDCAEDLIGLSRVVHTHDQQPGDVVVTLPGAFHAGFSAGMNFGEAINWGTADWIRAFERPPNSPCQCRANLTFDGRLWSRMRCQLLLT